MSSNNKVAIKLICKKGEVKMKKVRINQERKYVVRRRIAAIVVVVLMLILHQFITAKLTGRGGFLTVNMIVRLMLGSKLSPLIP